MFSTNCLVAEKPDHNPCFMTKNNYSNNSEKKKSKSKSVKPFYGMHTKRQVIDEYYRSSASMKELSEIYGILGSNTVSNWLKKYGNLRSKKSLKKPIMNKPHASIQDKKNRAKRYKTNEQLYLSQLESDLDIAQKRKIFYALAVDIINELALELTGVDLLKKTSL